jgi:hypothetical protein
MSTKTEAERELPAVRVRAVALARPRRPVWLSELLLVARHETDEAADGSDDVVAGRAGM